MNNRITAIDSVRGLVILLMILGHTRYEFAPVSFDPIELSLGTTGLYLTRVLTNICAPIFFLLSGMGIYLLVQSYQNLALASQDLVKRGILLLAIELFFISWLVFVPFTQYTFLLQVLWALGISMILLSALIHLPIPWLLGISVSVILGHNVLDQLMDFTYENTFASFLLTLFHGSRTTIEINENIRIIALYAIVPWFAVMVFGYVLGHYLFKPQVTPIKRQQIFIYLGFGLLTLFILLKTIVGYGDPTQWVWQNDNIRESILYFFKVTKYPASLQYLSFALGIGFLLLALFDKWQGLGKYFQVFGQSALFIYLVHVPVLVLTSRVLYFILFGEYHHGPDQMLINLPWVYMIWLLFIPLFYGLCKWYRPVKMKYKHTILRYI